jgi:hypothetical protein
LDLESSPGGFHFVHAKNKKKRNRIPSPLPSQVTKLAIPTDLGKKLHLVLVVAQPAPIENYIPLGRRKSRVLVLDLRSRVSSNEGKKRDFSRCKIVGHCGYCEEQPRKKGAILTKKRTKKKEECKKEGEGGEDSVLAQISVLVCGHVPMKKKIALFSKDVPIKGYVKRCHHREHLRSPNRKGGGAEGQRRAGGRRRWVYEEERIEAD